MEVMLGLAVGIGLSAACGFRIFVPMLGISLAILTGHLTVTPDFAWLGTREALIAFSIATVLEIGAYYIPWLDNALDSITTPAAIIAGTIITAAMVGDVSPFLKWTLAIIAGGGVAALVQGGTVVARAGSTTASGGITNMLVSTLELIGAVIMTVLALLLPIAGFVLVLWLCYTMIRKIAGSTFFKSRFSKAA